jgi:hypothetical protein
MADGAPMRDEPIGIALEMYPAGQGIAGPRDEEPATARVEAGDELVGRRCDGRVSTGGNGNPTAPPALLTVIQQSISSCLRPGLTCSALVSWSTTRSAPSFTRAVCQAAASGCEGIRFCRQSDAGTGDSDSRAHACDYFAAPGFGQVGDHGFAYRADSYHRHRGHRHLVGAPRYDRCHADNDGGRPSHPVPRRVRRLRLAQSARDCRPSRRLAAANACLRDGVVHVVPEDRRLIRPGRPADLSAVVTNSLGWAHARLVAEAVTTTDGPSRSFSQPCSAARQVKNTQLRGCVGGGPGRTRAARPAAVRSRSGRCRAEGRGARLSRGRGASPDSRRGPRT